MTSAESPAQAYAATLTAMQIGMTAERTRRAGVDRYYFNLLPSLVPHGVVSKGLVVGATGDLDALADVAVFAPEGVNLLKRWGALRRTVPNVLRHSDLAVSHFAPYAFPVLDELRARPFIVHFHGPWAFESKAEGAGALAVAAKHALERVVYSRASGIIVLSRAFAAILERQYGVPATKIRVIPGGVDLERFSTLESRSDAKRRLGWSTDRPTLLTVRRLVRAKGLENLLDAIRIVRKSVPDVLVVIAGSGPLAPELKRRVAEYELDDTVQFTGFVAETDLPTMYRAADLFIVPTIALEGFGLVVLEALASGTPAMVTPVEGLPEVVEGLDRGLVFAGTRADDLAAGLCDALTGRFSLPSGDACVDHARRFAWPHIAGRVASVYREFS